ncbi:MAG: RNase adapter RapZ [Candidatus Aminicenantales bacterium]
MKNDRFLIITGMSGSGKTAVSRFLEDMGYYCMDNLPAKLIPDFVNLWTRREVEIAKVALVVDIREAGFTTDFPRVLKKIREKVSPRLIFLEASDETLVTRFKETRRPHPLARRRSVLESVALERKRLTGIKKLADDVIDTSTTSISDLKRLLTTRVLRGKEWKLQILIVSFGYKYGIPLDSDLVFDTRFLPNPFYIEELRDKTGRSKKVKDYVLSSLETKKFLKELFRFVDYLMPHFVEEGKSYLNVSIGCTGGKHRAVVIAEELKNYLKKANHALRIYHRDIYK